jgi:DNA polymerase III subunit gamma/tau
MAYEVTATRKRPQSFEELEGQDFVVASLSNSIASGRIAHAYLFAGPRGIGKTSAARILAKSLNCEQGPTAQPCGTCANCREITQGNALDVIEIDGASNTSVNDVREIRDEVLFAPSSARYKVYIIDEVHMLSNSAFNALLKTIEEPPPYIVFIFATTEVHKVPATIRSRCQQFNFKLIGTDDIVESLKQVAGEMEISADGDALFWMAKEAAGSMRDAYTLYDQIVSFSDGTISMQLIQDKLGLVGFERVDTLATLLVEGKAKEAIELADDIISRGVNVEQLANDLTDYFRGVLFVKHGIEREALIGFNVSSFSDIVMTGLTVSQIEYALSELLQFYRDIRYSLNQRFEAELLLSKLSLASKHVNPTDLVKRIEAIKRQLTGHYAESDAVGDIGTASDEHEERDSAGEGTKSDQGEGESVGVGASGDASAAVTRFEARHAEPPATDQGAPNRDIQSATPPLTSETRAYDDDTPPDDVYENQYQQSSGQSTPPQPSPDNASVESPVQRVELTNETQSVVSDGEKETDVPVSGPVPEDKRGQIIDSLRRTHLTLATTLEKCVGWRFENDDIVIPCPTQFHAESIRREIQQMTRAVHTFIGKSLRVQLRTESRQSNDESDEDSDKRIDMIKRVFRGEVVDYGGPEKK